jgi:uncharacterized protein
MKAVLTKKIKATRLLEGFPGFGLVGPIATEYLIDRLECTQVGKFVYDELPATVAIHKGKIVHPMGIYHSKKHDLLIIHAILDMKGLEWLIVDAIEDLVKQADIKEIISIEGVAGTGGDGVYCYNNEAFKKQGAKEIEESVIMGVTAGLMVREMNVSCLFAETQSQIPDSRAAAKAIEYLEKYFGFDVDLQPLMDQAQLFEEKLKNIMQQTSKTLTAAEKKNISYLG